MPGFLELLGGNLANNPKDFIGNTLMGLLGYDHKAVQQKNLQERLAGATPSIFKGAGLGAQGEFTLPQGQEARALSSGWDPKAIGQTFSPEQRNLVGDVETSKGLLQLGGEGALPSVVDLLAPQRRRQREANKTTNLPGEVAKHKWFEGLSGEDRERAVAAGFGQRDPTFEEYQNMTQEQRAEYDRFKGRALPQVPSDVRSAEALTGMLESGDMISAQALGAKIFGSGSPKQAPGGGWNWHRLTPEGKVETIPISSDAAAQQGMSNVASAKERGRMAGQIQAEALAGLPSDALQMKTATGALEGILGHPGIEDAFGLDPARATGIIPGSKVADFNAKLEETIGKLAVQAYGILKGTGPVTEYEIQTVIKSYLNPTQHQSRGQFEQSVRDLQGFLRKSFEVKKLMSRGDTTSPEYQALIGDIYSEVEAAQGGGGGGNEGDWTYDPSTGSIR